MLCNSAKAQGHRLLIAWLLRKWATGESHYGASELHVHGRGGRERGVVSHTSRDSERLQRVQPGGGSAGG